MIYDALDIAAYVVKRCYKTNTIVSNLKLQKMLYFLQAEFLVSKNEMCFRQEIVAWTFGPVVPDVYRKYKIYGGAAIPYLENNRIINLSEDDKTIIDRIVEICSKYSASDLMEITHKQKPWIDAYSQGDGTEISLRSIKMFFEKG